MTLESFLDLLDNAGNPTSPPPGTEPGWAGFRELRVTGVVPETAAVSSIYLAAADGTRLPDARAGQYLTLRVPGAGTPAPVRSYTMSAAGGTGAYRISVKHEPHGVASGYLTGKLRPDTILEAAAPRGDFVLDADDGPVLLVSGGIGLTPVLAMLHDLAARRGDREVWWIHAARGPDDHPLAGEAHDLLAALPNAREHIFYSATTGRLTKAKLLALSIPAAASAYVCGPAAFMTDMRDALAAAGIDPGRIHTELFGALPAINPGITGRTVPPPHQPPGPRGTGPAVTFARSGITTPFPADGGSVLDLADACDVPTRWSCRTGVCHTCATPLLSGEVAYAPDPLEPAPGGEVLLCCARPTTDIVVDA